MLKSGRFKKVLIITMLVVLVLSTVALATDNTYVKKLSATFGRIKFKVNGKDVTNEIEGKYGSPAFIVDGRSYVPVRAIADLMGLEVEWDDSTHTAELIDVKSEKYEEEIDKKSKEIEELKKEIEKLKKNVVEETDIKDLEKKINNSYGTYKDVDFDITLKESSNKIDIVITMDLKTGKQESAWNRMTYNNRVTLVEDITNIVAAEFDNVDIYGSIYDEYLRRDVIEFNKKSGSKISVSYNDRTTSGTSSKYIDELVDDEFYKLGIKDAYITHIDADSRSTVYFDIIFSDKYKSEWRNATEREIENILDKVADEVLYYYDDYYDYYDDYRYDRDVSAYVYMDSSKMGSYSRRYDDKYGEFRSY